MTHAEAEGHHHAEGCSHDHAATGELCAQDAACAGSAEACGMEEGACCGGHGQNDLFAFPTTAESVTVPAVQLAGLLDLVEKLCEDPRLLTQEPDYLEAQRALGEQAPELVSLRDEFLDRMRTLLSEAQAAH
ncbi:MAG TPA: hypothetical protein VET24_08505 [Actinomycetota bacterium]|nr:hypothetical protein [Actinomycetota bacterium]